MSSDDDAIYPGSPVLLTMANRIAGELTDVPLLYLYVVDPFGAESTFDSTDGFIIKDSTGTYHANFPVPLTGGPGEWGYRWYGPNMLAKEGTFYVSPSIRSGVTTTSTPTPPPIALTLTDFPYICTSYLAAEDGVTDDYAALLAAITAAHNAGGGQVITKGHSRTSQTLPMYENVRHVGWGGETTARISLMDGANCDLFTAGVADIDIHAAANTGPVGIAGTGFINIDLDVNSAGQDDNGPYYAVRAYLYGYKWVNSDMTGDVLTDWNESSASPGNNSMEGQIVNCKLHGAVDVGFVLAGPHDTQMVNTIIYDSGSHNLYVGPHCPGVQVANSHFWGCGVGVGAVAVLLDAGKCSFTNCSAEGSDTAQVVIHANECGWHGGQVFGATLGGSAFWIGQAASLTPLHLCSHQTGGGGSVTTAVSAAAYDLSPIIDACDGTSRGTFYFANDGGGAAIDCNVWLPTGLLWSGSINRTVPSKIHWRVKGGGNVVDANVSALLVPGDFVLTPSATSPSLGNGGTIAVTAVGVAQVTPSADVTGIILHAGAWAGQTVFVDNQSAHTITFAASGSNIADGNASAIPANAGRLFVWNGSAWKRSA